MSLARTAEWLRELGRIERGFEVGRPALDAHLVEAYLARFEILDVLGAGSNNQRAVEIEGPRVVGAGQLLDSAFTADELVPAVLADVVKSLQFTLLVARRDHRLTLDIQGYVTAGFAQFFLVAKELPAAVKNLFALHLEELGIEVTAGIDRVRAHRDLVVPALDLVEIVCAQRRG